MTMLAWLLLWIIICSVLAPLLGVLLDLAGFLCSAFFYLLGDALAWLFRKILQAGAFLFSAITARAHWQRKQSRNREYEQAPRTDAPCFDPYRSAREILGLPESFSKEEFIKAYRKAIRRAHPDCGGTTERAQAVNEARERIAARHCW